MDELKVAGETIQFIVIRLGDEQYGIDIKYIDNILRMPSITRVPKVAPYLKGVINLRGEVLPVMSIRIKMGLEEDVITKSSRIIVLKMEQLGMIGIIVDEVKEVVTLEADQIEKVAYDSKDEKDNFISGIGKCEGGLISLLDLNQVVPENS
ncbi:MAG: chemotaxis protein CheW [Roseburia sp.]|nr:chemotaxis protein CheW [Ruminococcus sp.]MCM1155924.1 chemotaxis protein CheW [Roseburia sp.]MCM1242863.1 chemotaxis protein CheW [Roseburia sp.]